MTESNKPAGDQGVNGSRGWLAELHADERGMETLNIVMVMGISAIILLVMWQFFPNIRVWVNYMFDKVTEKEPPPLD